MNWAVIKFSGKQYLVKVGDKIQVNNLPQNPGEVVNIAQVLLATNEKVSIGTPVIENFKVTARIIKKFSGRKITVTKFKAKSRYLRDIGFRPKLAEIEITKIGA